MYPCIESIEWRDGSPQRLEYHQRRVDEAFRVLYPWEKPFLLKEELDGIVQGTSASGLLRVTDVDTGKAHAGGSMESLPVNIQAPSEGLMESFPVNIQVPSASPPPVNGLYKLRLVYDKCIRELEWQEYRMRTIKSLKLIEIQHDSMHFKTTDRNFIDLAFAGRGACDDIVMVNRGLITDSSYANVAFFDGQKWVSPRIPLLYGTRRAYLLDQGLIETAEIIIADLPCFQRIRLFNAMIGFGELDLPIEAIVGY